MILYSVIMFFVALMLIVFGILIYFGKTNLIHSYHMVNVKDNVGYGKAFGKALCLISLPLIAAGVTAFFTDSYILNLILLVGLAVSFIPLILVQKKYNGGLF